MGQTYDCKIGICCFSAKNPDLRSKSKDWLVQIQDNVSECSDMSKSSLNVICICHDIAVKLLIWC